jgi:hypothetical protein
MPARGTACYTRLSQNASMQFDSSRIIWSLLTERQRRGAVLLIGAMVGSTALEAVGIGMFLPAIAVIASPDPRQAYPFLTSALRALGEPSYTTFALAMLGTMVVISAIKMAVTGVR